MYHWFLWIVIFIVCDGYLRYYMSLCDNPRDIKQRLVLTKKKKIVSLFVLFKDNTILYFGLYNF